MIDPDTFFKEKKILIIGIILLGVGIAGFAFSFISARTRAEELHKRIEDYNQKQCMLDKFLEGSVSFSQLTKTLENDQWQTLLNAEGQGFVAEQWLLAISLITILFGATILIAFFSI